MKLKWKPTKFLKTMFRKNTGITNRKRFDSSFLCLITVPNDTRLTLNIQSLFRFPIDIP